MKPLLLMTLPLLALVGCQTLEQEIVLPGVDDSPPAVLLGHVPGGLPADFYEDAAEVTGQAVLRYVALSDQITAEGGVNPQSMKPLVSSEWWVVEQEGFAYFVEEGFRTQGTSEVSRFLVQSARLTPSDSVEVGVIACVDTTGVIVFPSESPDPPHILWQWHPAYEISGDYRIGLEVTYEASYRFDGGAFQSLPGQITRSGGDKVVEVLSVTPVLVDRGCHSETLVAGRC